MFVGPNTKPKGSLAMVDYHINNYNLVFIFTIGKSLCDSLDKNLKIFIEIINEIKAPSQ